MTHSHETTEALHRPFADGQDAHSEPLYITSAYDFESAQQASDRFNNREAGNVYSRFTNPSVRNFERRLAIMEKAEDAVATSSGMGAYLAIAMAYLKQGDHVLLANGIFGSTSHLFTHYFSQFGISCTRLPLTATAAWREAILPTTRMMILETPGNPTMEVADIQALSRFAKESGVLLVVDNTILSPIYQKPLTLGADLVVQSAGKYIDGQGRCVGGAVAGNSTLVTPIKNVLRSGGMCLSAFDGWLLSKSLETLHARMVMHETNALHVVRWLQDHPDINQVNYTGQSTRVDTDLVDRQQTGHGGLLSAEINGGQDAAWRFMDSLALIAKCTNIGDAKTMVTHPWSTTHCRYSNEEKLKAGITPGLIRLSVGLEFPGDIIADLEQALAQICQREVVSA
ncbi:aminotransferase class I/II-fold pyridoxal phosphate-dependent enzyme [Marinobacter lipolyticus]|uniref:aminotransferase class I/II-fold pyridoxal phosphate-dependent enzyme n=1 Tax=Marinobacter lipolyticus TaxID=209639 RepID=UPI001BCD160A|nr:aminotransferase class I/II-fold pyridoxal phosphate-dependent enzyme [Marinobacter lipolyticus]MBS8239169.1 aminotransferase class I/II-fold pyridoxal phosphate-dependent enzyme [Marinobacter lipolyticus]